MNFNTWLDTLLSEKNIDAESVCLVITGESGIINYMPLSVVIEAIKATGKAEQSKIKDVLVKLDFMNRDIVDYFKHLAKAIVV